jgi:hypothetical protein
MQKLPLGKIASVVSVLFLAGFGAGCQTPGEAPVEPAYVVGATPLGMRLDPIIWGTIAHFDIVGVDGDAPKSKARVSVTPGQHTISISATGGFSGKTTSSSVDFNAKSGHTYLLRPTNIGGSIYAIVIDNDEGMVVFRPKLTVVATESVAVASPPVPPKPDSLEFNADGSLKTKKSYKNDAKGRVITETVSSGAGVLLYKESYYYGYDGRLVRTDERGATGKLEKVVVYFDTFAKVLDGDGNVIGTEDAPKK